MTRHILTLAAAAILATACTGTDSYDDGYDDGYTDGYDAGYEAAEVALADELTDDLDATDAADVDTADVDEVDAPIDLIWQILWADEPDDGRDQICEAVDLNVDVAVQAFAQGYDDDPDVPSLTDGERDLLADEMQALCDEHTR